VKKANRISKILAPWLLFVFAAFFSLFGVGLIIIHRSAEKNYLFGFLPLLFGLFSIWVLSRQKQMPLKILTTIYVYFLFVIAIILINSGCFKFFITA